MIRIKEVSERELVNPLPRRKELRFLYQARGAETVDRLSKLK